MALVDPAILGAAIMDRRSSVRCSPLSDTTLRQPPMRTTDAGVRRAVCWNAGPTRLGAHLWRG